MHGVFTPGLSSGIAAENFIEWKVTNIPSIVWYSTYLWHAIPEWNNRHDACYWFQPVFTSMMKLQKKSLGPDAKSVAEENMAVSLFVGLMGGAILGFATQKNHSQLCEFIRVRHPLLFKSIGLAMLGCAILIPTLSLSGVLSINVTPFFWGGCMALSFIYGFFTVHCQFMQEDQKV